MYANYDHTFIQWFNAAQPWAIELDGSRHQGYGADRLKYKGPFLPTAHIESAKMGRCSVTTTVRVNAL